MFTVTHISEENGYKTTVLRSGNLTAVCTSTHRGGCLYAGGIRVFNTQGGFTNKTIDSTMGIGLLQPLEVGQDAPKSTSDYLSSLCARFVVPLSTISPTELKRLAQTGQYTPDSMLR